MKIAALLAFLAATDDAIGAWVPPPLLAALVLALLSALILAVTYIARITLKRLDKMESTLETIEKGVPHFVSQAQLEAAREAIRIAMGSLGDRMDSRIQKVSDRLAVVENDLGKEIAVRQTVVAK